MKKMTRLAIPVLAIASALIASPSADAQTLEAPQVQSFVQNLGSQVSQHINANTHNIDIHHSTVSASVQGLGVHTMALPFHVNENIENLQIPGVAFDVQNNVDTYSIGNTQVAPEIVTNHTNNLYQGESRVVSEGSHGVNFEVSKTTNGTKQTLHSNTVTQASPKIVEQGTKARVTAPQATAPQTAQGVWDALAQCESGGNWAINTGNGYSGGLQFHPATWSGHGGGKYAPSAHQATRDQQIDIAKKVQASQGWGAWPSCSAKLGLR